MIANGQTERIVEIPWLLGKIGHPESILDIGSADAKYLNDLQGNGARVTSIDTRQYSVPAGVNIIVGDAAELPNGLADSFDLITCVSVLDHVGLEAYGNHADPLQMDKVISEMHRVLKAGGRLLLTVPFGRDHVTTHPRGGQRVFDANSLLKLFDAKRWKWLGVDYWKLEGDEYNEAEWTEVKDAEYAITRAGAVVGLELAKW